MSQKETFLTYRKLIICILESVLLSIAILVLTVQVIKYNAVDENGHDQGDYTTLSLIVFTVSLFNINIINVLNASHTSWLFYGTIFLTSLLPFGIFVYLYDRSKLNVDTKYSSRFALSHVKFYL
jgi:hypothetical protein